VLSSSSIRSAETLSRRVTGSSRRPATSACSAPRRPRPAKGQDTGAWRRCS
jgi:hypothetical protein